MDDREKLARLVSLACHDLRTPLATVLGFARTLRRSKLGAREARYVELIDAASVQLGDLIESLALDARIESGRYRPAVKPTDVLQLASRVRDHFGDDAVEVSGAGGSVAIEPAAAERAVIALVDGARRYGGGERVTIEAAAASLTLAPISAETASVLLAEDPRDLGAAIARNVVHALGGSLEAEGETLVVRFAPSEEAATGAGP